jgi:hypothetical protein
VLRGLEIVDEAVIRSSPWTFVPELSADPELDVDLDVDLDADLDVELDADLDAALDPADRAAVDAATSSESAISALWRAWRIPVDGSAQPAPKRVFVVALSPGREGRRCSGSGRRVAGGADRRR